MKNKQRGFIVPLVIVVALIVIGGGIYVYKNKKTEPQITNPDIVGKTDVSKPIDNETQTPTDAPANVKKPDITDTTFSGTETTYINNFSNIEGYAGEYAMIAELDFVQAKICPGGEYHGPVPCVVNENPKVRHFSVRHDVKITGSPSGSPDGPTKNLDQLITLVRENNSYANTHEGYRQWFTVKIDKGLITEINIDYVH